MSRFTKYLAAGAVLLALTAALACGNQEPTTPPNPPPPPSPRPRPPLPKLPPKPPLRPPR